MHLGIDLGGTKIEVAVLDSGNQSVYSKRIPSPRDSYDATCRAIASLIHETETALNAECTLGLGVPGSISPETGLVQNANSTWLIGQRIVEDLSNLLSRPIYVANDADCFTLSEASDGAASDAKCVFGVILGTGVGGGICINGQPLVGPNAITGEWGHNPMHYSLLSQDSNCNECYCGREYCIETYLSGPGFVARFNQLYGTNYSRVEEILSHKNSRDLELCKQTYIRQLAGALSGVVNILDPDCIVLGGGLSNMDFIYEDLPSAMSEFVFSDTFKTPIRRALHGDASGVRGAAWLGKKQPD